MEQTILDVTSDPVYQELLCNYQHVSPEAVETILKLNKVSSIINTRKEAVLNEHGLTHGRFHLLMLLKREEPSHCLSPSELAKRTGVTRGTMTQFIDAIEKDGFVTRIEDPKDRRGMLVELTSKGEERLKILLPIHIQNLANYTKVLNSEEKAMMLQIMLKMASIFKSSQDKQELSEASHTNLM